MTTRNSTLVGVLNERAQAENVIEQLRNIGIPDDQIYYSGSTTGTGGFFAGLKSLFTGEDTSGDSLANDLAGMGLSQDEANYYRNEYQAGRSIVAVNPSNRWQEAQNALNSAGAYNYASRTGNTDTYTQTASSGYTTEPNYATQTSDAGYTRQAANPDYASQTTGASYSDTRASDYANTDDEGQRMKLREERLNVDKQTVQTGEARLHKNVVEEQQNIDVPFNREEVVVQRQSYGEDRPTDASVGQDETIRVPVSEEQVNTSKQTVETGEVAIGKRTVQDQQRVSETVRREEARLDKDGNPTIRENNPNTDQGNY